MAKKISQPWDFVPANADTRANFQAGAGNYFGKGVKAKLGKIRSSFIVSPPQDKTSGFKKKITQA